MTNKLIIFLLLLTANCGALFQGFESREKLGSPINVSYSSENIFAEISLTTKINKYKNYYCGVMKSQLLSKKDHTELRLSYKDKELEIYPDTIVDVIEFWSRKNWDFNGFRSEKVCVWLNDESIDWKTVKIIEKGA